MHLRIHLEGVRVDVRRKFGLHANLLLDGKRRFNAIGLQGMAGWYRLPPARPERILVQERNMNIQLRACGQVFVFVLAFCLLDSCKRMIQPEGSPMTSQTNRPPSVLDTVSDDDFFRGGDFLDFTEELSKDPRSTKVEIGGAKSWDPAKWPDYPLLVGMKVKQSEIDVIHPYTHGHVLVLNRESGELFVAKAWEPHKMPLARSRKEPATEEEPAETDTRTLTSLNWVRLPGKLAQVPPSKLEIRFLTGGDLAGPVVVSTGTGGLRWQERPSWHASRSVPTASDLADPRFEPRPGQARLADPGVRLLAEPKVSQWHGQSVRWGVSGGICLGESAIAWDVEWIDVHLVFAWKGSRYVQEHDLRIPKRVFRKENGLFHADFFLDLYPVFEERQGEVPRIPQGLHVTAVCASQFFGPYPLDMSPFAVSGR